MQIKDEAGFFPSFLNLLLDVVNGRSSVLRWLLPYSIRIYSSQFCSSVAVNDSIRVDHWYDLEDVVIVEGVACLNCLDH